MKNLKISTIILVVWLLFSIIYVGINEYNRLNFVVAQNAYNQGYRDSAVQLVSEVSKCQPVPVTIDNQTVHVIGVSCLQQQEVSEAE